MPTEYQKLQGNHVSNTLFTLMNFIVWLILLKVLYLVKQLSFELVVGLFNFKSYMIFIFLCCYRNKKISSQ